MAAVSNADQMNKYRDTANVYSKLPEGKAVAMESSGSSEEDEEETDAPPLPKRNMRVKFQEEPLPKKEKPKQKQKRSILKWKGSDEDTKEDTKGEVRMKRDTLRGDSVRVATKGERDVDLTYKVLQTDGKKGGNL
ncbi:uncharacterized protein LOC134235699 [Saccostrea cucullata]|uniref:uncharacterized protein LOC134235699 n=1 Tax=Saccostrea cuccullata TaxID=36930 RepID=UPI002ED67B0F